MQEEGEKIHFDKGKRKIHRKKMENGAPKRKENRKRYALHQYFKGSSINTLKRPTMQGRLIKKNY